MAWLIKEGKYWHAAFRNRKGKIIQRTTRILIKGEDRRESIALKNKASVAATRFEMAANGEIGTQDHLRRVLAELVEMSGSSQVETLELWLAKYLPKAEARYSKSAFNSVSNILDLLYEKAGGNTPLASITAEVIQAVLDDRASVRSSATVTKERKFLSKCFSDAVRQGLLDKNPVAATTVAPTVGVERKPFTEKEVADILKVASGELFNIITIAVNTGLRLHDCIRIEPKFYDKALDAIVITESKTKKDLTIPANDATREIVTAGPVAPELNTLSNGAINKRLLKVMDAAEIDREPVVAPGAKNIVYRKSFHSFRHTFISRLTNAGVDPEIRRKLAGHSSVDIHEIYTHHNLERLREAVTSI